MRSSDRRVPILGLSLLIAAALAPPASAALDIDFGASVRMGDRTEVFVAVSSRYFDQDRDEVRRLGVRYRNPDDLAVSLFLARHAGQRPERMLTLRSRGMSWWEISVHLGLPVDIWFVEVDRPPGPPYGKAYGYWKKHRARRAAFSLTDDDCRNLVAVRVMHEYYGVPVATAMDWRTTHGSLDVVIAHEYQRRHSPGHKARSAGKGHGKHKKKK